MAKASFGNHSAVRVPRGQKDRIRRFYRDVLGGEVMREGDQKDDFRLGGDFYIAFMYEDEGVLDEDGFGKSIYLELKTDEPEAMRERIVAFGVTVLDVPDPHLYFQAPGGQVFRLVGVGEDLSTYEGTEHGEQFVGKAFGVRSLRERRLSAPARPGPSTSSCALVRRKAPGTGASRGRRSAGDLRPGRSRYGQDLTACTPNCWASTGPGDALEISVALPTIRAGADVYVARCLVVSR